MPAGPTDRPQRRSERKRFPADVDVIVAGRSRWARGWDLSQHGASFGCEFKLGTGDAIQLDFTDLGAGIRMAVVRHAAIKLGRYHVGVEFFDPLSEDQVARLAGSATPRRRS
jgi:hypothetical protein